MKFVAHLSRKALASICRPPPFSKIINVPGHMTKMVSQYIRGLLFKFVDFLYSRSELFDRGYSNVFVEYVFYFIE